MSKKCELCGKFLDSRKRQKRFCSSSCRSKVVCRKSILAGWSMKGRKHSSDTKKNIAMVLTGKVGENSRNWKGGSSRAYKNGYYSLAYKNWRSSVFIRDKYTCQSCGETGDKSYLTAHHIKSFAHYPELRYEISNGKTLCEICHSHTDNYKGRGVKRVKNEITIY